MGLQLSTNKKQALKTVQWGMEPRKGWRRAYLECPPAASVTATFTRWPGDASLLTSPPRPHQSCPTSPLRAIGGTGFGDSFAEHSHSSEDEVVDLGTTVRVAIR